MNPGPLELRESLQDLLARIEADPRLVGELARARREFFGADRPDYLDGESEREAAAMRFAEWFLLERPSDVLGAAPVDVFAAEALRESVAGVFLVEVASGDVQVRDLSCGARLGLSSVPDALAPGDVLVGRLYAVADGSHVPSAASSLLKAAPRMAVAFQRDVKNLALDRRLTQAELEHLLFRRWGRMRGLESARSTAPLERTEAELQRILEEVGKDSDFAATDLSAALKKAAQPRAVIEPFLDEMAFDTDADLDRLRQLLWEIAHAVRAEDSAGPPAPAENPPARTPDSAAAFTPRPGETLGQQVARRIEEGMANHEPVADLFDDVERMIGGEGDGAGDSVDDEATDQLDIDDGDLVPLVREFAWETGANAEDEAVLSRFVASIEATVVPRLHLEYLEEDDVLRFLLQVWLESPPAGRRAALERAFSALERFYCWAEDTQKLPVLALLAKSRTVLVDAAGRLSAAGLSLSTTDDPTAIDPGQVRLMRITRIGDGELCVAVGEESTECRIEPDPHSIEHLAVGDLLLGALHRPADEPARLRGMVVVVPGAVEHLLG